MLPVPVKQAHHSLDLWIFQLKPLTSNNTPKNIDDRDTKQCLHPEEVKVQKKEHRDANNLMSWLSSFVSCFTSSSTSSWITPSKPTFPNPKSFKCFKANLLCSTQYWPSVVMIPWNRERCIYTKYIIWNRDISFQFTLLTPLSDLRYLEMMFWPLPHHSSRFSKSFAIWKFWMLTDG